MRTLIISPHIDDEAISCSGFLGKDTFVYFCGVEPFHIVSVEQRLRELKDVSEFYGYRYSVDMISVPNKYNRRNFIDQFQDLINRIRPELMIIPYYGFNQDHQEIYEASMVALRPNDKIFFVKKVLVFEGPDCLWSRSDYKINYYKPINIGKKIEGYKLHKSQVRSFRGEEILRALAKVRGSVIGVPYAEGYIIERWVE